MKTMRDFLAWLLVVIIIAYGISRIVSNPYSNVPSKYNGYIVTNINRTVLFENDIVLYKDGDTRTLYVYDIVLTKYNIGDTIKESDNES